MSPVPWQEIVGFQADRADAIQRMARGRVAVQKPWRSLTAREYAVARLVSEGFTNGEIADSLGITEDGEQPRGAHLGQARESRRAEIASSASAVVRTPQPT
ncbi:MAG: LuxR C-terminal-related transcriptional regulator [Chloroflexota bacterium]